MQNRLKSRVAWVSVLAIVGFAMGNWGLFERVGLTDETWKTLAELVLAAMAAFGVFNNPTNGDGF